jgi:hypothetical protein
MSEHKKESIRMRARYLTQAYRIALDSMPYKSWHDCCQEAINALAAVGIRYIKNSRVLQLWNDEFCQRKRFSNNNKGKRDLPAFLQAHPILVTDSIAPERKKHSESKRKQTADTGYGMTSRTSTYL